MAKGVASSGVCGRQGMLRLPKKRRIAEAGATWQADNAATCCAGGFSWPAQFGPPNRFQRSGRRRRWQPQACWQQSLGVSIVPCSELRGVLWYIICVPRCMQSGKLAIIKSHQAACHAWLNTALERVRMLCHAASHACSRLPRKQRRRSRRWRSQVTVLQNC